MRNLALFGTVVLLTLTFLMVMPPYVEVKAVTQNPAQKTAWSPFGPASLNLVMHDYSDPGTMFNAFKAGQVDITDWPIQAPDLGTFCSNADIWCSAPDPELGVSQLDVNNHASFLGQTMENTRSAFVGSVTNIVSGSSTACATGFGQLTLNVVNGENNTQPFKDPLNSITISNQPSGTPSATVSDSGGSSPTGTYQFPCILAGTYLMTSAIMVTGNSTTGSHLGCGVLAGCTITVPPGALPNGGTVSATWNVFWNSSSTLTPSAAMPGIMKAISHLVDKPEFVQHDALLNGHASCDDIMLAPANLIPGSPCVVNPPSSVTPGTPFPSSVLSGECGNLVLDSVITACGPVSAYNLVDDNIGSSAVWWGVPGRTARGSVAVGYSGPADIDAACQYFLGAGFVLTPSGSTCAQLAQASVGTTQPFSYPHLVAPAGAHAVAYIESSDPSRTHFGQILADSLNMLFGTPNDSGSCPAPCNQTSTGSATVLYGNGAGGLQPTATYVRHAVALQVVGDTTTPDDWNIYTGATTLGAAPDSLASYNSKFASSVCGGAFNDLPVNYVFHCDPAFDGLSNAGEFQSSSSPILSFSISILSEAAVREFTAPWNVPVYSHIQQFAELNAWNWQSTGSGLSSSLVIQEGHGTQIPFWTFLNARQLPGYTPANPIYTGGGGNPNLIRYGLSQDPDTVNPFQATSASDWAIISQIFDTLLQVNPETIGPNEQNIEWMNSPLTRSFTQGLPGFVSDFFPNDIECLAQPSVSATTCVRGVTRQSWHLRNDVFFHDGTFVTASDVCYSILAARDVPSALLQSSASSVTNCIARDAGTVEVNMTSNSPYYQHNFEARIGSIPILPAHLWAPVCGQVSTVSTPHGPVNAIVGGPTSPCAIHDFDPATCTTNLGAVTNCGKTFADGSVQGILVGSGPWACFNVGPGVAAGLPGGSCFESSTGAVISGTQFALDSRILLRANTNYMRGVRGAQGNSLQKESWADFNNDGVVDINDPTDAGNQFDKPNSYWTHPQYACSPTATVIDICVMSAIIVFFDEGLTGPFGGVNIKPSTQLIALDPQIDPYSMQLSVTSVCLYYRTTTTSATGLLLVNCDHSSTTSLPAGHTITGSAAVLNADGTLGTSQSGSVSVSGGTVTSSWSPALVHGTQYEIRIFDNGAQIGQFFATP